MGGRGEVGGWGIGWAREEGGVGGDGTSALGDSGDGNVGGQEEGER